MAKNVLQSTILIANGGVSVAPGASIEIRNAASGLLVPLWLDRDGTQPTTNPFYADSNGFFRVYLDAGRYHITASKDGQSQEWRDVLLGSAAGYDVTTSPTDTTVGRLLKVGDFGIGSSEELAYWRDRAALLDPAAYRFYNGVDDGANWSFTVPAGETWYALGFWRVVMPSDSAHLFLYVADVSRPLPLPAGTTIQAAIAGAHAYICRPALVVDSDPRYNNPRGLYFNRLARLRTLTLHRQTVQVPSGSSMGLNFTTEFPTDFANGFVVGVAAQDVSWVGLSKGAAGALGMHNRVSDDHQIRFAEVVKFPFRRAIFPQLRARPATISGNTSDQSLQGYGAVFYYKLPADW